MTPLVDKTRIETKVIELLCAHFSTHRGAMTARSRLVEDLNADSVDLVEISMLIGEAFNLDLPSDEVAGWQIVADITRSIADGYRRSPVEFPN
ncbi:acyl carrier protein [Pseudomonas sp. RGM2987]|uniref:phosphopantetheine-binding protein n=1 Tax=Pseudomonas sp. RGM2987 TaxID=2930090 RepID=UPI001FD7058D|nr:acyl carrier protein [Pseudomonas sp. RGM2987]MCJ8204782.1 acyl carrier protein [Pseudomonas sp. RGM2987]